MDDLLSTIDTPSDLRRLHRRDLPQLAHELRTFMLDSVSQTGGHLSPNLGVVELTIALHYVFDTPHDRIVWDVGHQTYPHKILTGRRERMNTLRQPDGISGFPVRAESEYDAFGTAHSSTSISAALGMAIAAKLQKVKRHSIAVIGDGAMTAGMAFEAMNNVGAAKGMPFMVILNDNDMSISPPVGALNRYLSRLMSGRFYAATRTGAGRVLNVVPPVRELARKLESHAKGMIVPATLFEEFGFNYIGPIDGHDLDSLILVLENIKQLHGPQFLHVVTKKGQGYSPAKADPVLYHSTGRFNLKEGIKPSVTPRKKTYSQVFGEWLCDAAELDSRVVGITPAMREGSGMVEFEKRFPHRYFDVGIAEQHAVTFAAGLAAEGLKPVVAIYSTFLQRAYDQLIHDVALQNLPVVFAIDRAGIVGADGATHLGSYDMAFLRCIPNMIIMAASNENECRQMLYTALQQSAPTAVRYPRGVGTGIETVKEMTAIPIGKGETLRHISQPSKMRIAILAFGAMVEPAVGAAELIDATVANMRFVKPLDIDLIHHLAATHDAIVTVEEGCVMGGAGSACAEALFAQGMNLPVLQLGLPDQLIDHGDPAKLLADCRLDSAGIATSIRARFQTPLPENVANPLINFPSQHAVTIDARACFK
ncbi:1-deoxy-D-xylulose-5-phosphate synthase [Herbaspirillum sp. SJZ099]|uniref:1-deoxy-D-xylulose-5-phosphate synthase n=1 Tax=Herbaspirillum sp. SJZ099 TaxID=2572916 RepID=UPI00119C9202|nr:1-deoxy-D-xylulose-5-phosphate synthase [Herbaspirillum sp. SJZ099]TWC62126.1 1-deoxy-D-xylulose-5-phosphate synthase [Herbaspirillum sp. SJZ099]